MVWNKDLAKLKQDLKAEEPAGSKRPAPKPVPKPLAPQALEDEDALFLAAMGGRRMPAPGREPEAEPPARVQAAPPPEDFGEAMAALKGMKPMAPPVVRPVKETPAPVPAPPAEPVPEAASPIPVPEAPPAREPAEEPTRPVPPLIQLAAGMAIEVDGALDLRGHSPADAMERLKERILDGHLLGWRTLHIQLGPAEDLREAFLAFLGGPEGALIARYAQAPIPMGGTQAWILYLGLQSPALH